jgi:hypothetical protein
LFGHKANRQAFIEEVKMEKRVKSEVDKENEDPDTESSPPRKRPKRSSSGKHLTVRIMGQKQTPVSNYKDDKGIQSSLR